MADDAPSPTHSETDGRDDFVSHSGAPPRIHRDRQAAFFGRIAEELIRGFAPRLVFDAGCATGLLVEAFFDRGVAAHGRDISTVALSKMRQDIRPFCQLGSIADPILRPGEPPYDLITCIEVLEHMPPDQAIAAIAAMTAAAPRIVFAATPIDRGATTHAHIRPTIYWLQQFATADFLPLARYDAGFIAPHAFVLERAQPGTERSDIVAFAGLIRQRLELAQRESELARLRATVGEMVAEQNRLQAMRAQALEAEGAAQEAAAAAYAAARRDAEQARLLLDRVLHSTAWRLTGPARAMGETVKLGWRAGLAALRHQAAPAQPMPTAVSEAEDASDRSAAVALRRRFAYLEPLASVTMSAGSPRVTIVTDSINPDSLYGGVGTAIVLGAMLARRLGASLRLVTRVEPLQTGVVQSILALHGVHHDGNIAFLTSDLTGNARQVPTHSADLFLTTSWWTTWAARRAIPPRQILYLLQEDERLFYPRGDEQLRCAELLADPELRFIVNSQLLFDHLTTGPDRLATIAEHGAWFEPAFPAQPARLSQAVKARRDFLFYARPANPRNLYWRGLETIIAALDSGVLDPRHWNLHFVGRDLVDLVLPHDVRPTLHESLSWADYAALVATVDVGLSLMLTPHPSYPPLDLAAGGAVAVTNQCGIKTSLSRYSRNILCVPPTTEALTRGLAEAIRLAEDSRTRAENHAANGLGRDWHSSLAGVLDRFAKLPG
jgi:SAM-dependent methyltransferase